jgi:hypothetical protein
LGGSEEFLDFGHVGHAGAARPKSVISAGAVR